MINRHKCGLAFGLFVGSCHLIWAWLVLTGIAQTVINWIFRLHFIDPPFILLPFNLGVAVALVVITFMSGYVTGWTLAALLNWLESEVRHYRPMSSIGTRRHATGH